MSRYLVTGASGFIGHRLSEYLSSQGHEVWAMLRTHADGPWHRAFCCDLESDPLPVGLMEGVDGVFHLANVAHTELKDSDAERYKQVNVIGTKALLHAAADASVSRFVYFSSVKAAADPGEKCVDEKWDHMPEDAYGISKWEAEQALHEVSARTGLEVVIIRPPLVYGPGVKGNFLSLLGWLNKSIPLPLGAIHNQRSLVGIDNLIDLIITCIDHPAAANQTFLVSDDEDISTTELLKRMGGALGKPTRLLPVPSSLLQFGAKLLGKQDIAQRLLGNLQLDISHTKEILGWAPPVSVDEGLNKTAEWFLNKR
jgi:nucleoside-diphosphate-sugar epimerase